MNISGKCIAGTVIGIDYSIRQEIQTDLFIP